MADVVEAGFVVVEVAREKDGVVNYAFASHRQVPVAFSGVVTLEDPNITVRVVFVALDVLRAVAQADHQNDNRNMTRHAELEAANTQCLRSPLADRTIPPAIANTAAAKPLMSVKSCAIRRCALACVVGGIRHQPATISTPVRTVKIACTRAICSIAILERSLREFTLPGTGLREKTLQEGARMANLISLFALSEI